MSTFEEAIDTVLEHEGGLSDNPNDPGGLTNYGISLRWALKAQGEGPELKLLLDMDGDGDVDRDDIRYMTEENAKDLYRHQWWDKFEYDRLLYQGVATKVFDTAINVGARQAHKFLQRAVQAMGVTLVDDGMFGPQTLRSVNDADPIGLVPAMRSEQAGFYRALIMRNNALIKRGLDVPDFSVFQKGWLRRAYA